MSSWKKGGQPSIDLYVERRGGLCMVWKEIYRSRVKGKKEV